MASFEMLNKLLEISKSVHNHPVVPVTQPAEDVQILLSPALMTLEMVPDLPASSDPPEVADLALDPGEWLQVRHRARENDVADHVSVLTNVFEPEVTEDVLERLVVISTVHVAEFAGESELKMTLLDVTLCSLTLPGNSLATVRTEPRQANVNGISGSGWVAGIPWT